MFRVNHCFRNCSTHCWDFSVVSGSHLQVQIVFELQVSSDVEATALSFEAVAACAPPPFKWLSISSLVIRPFLPEPATALMLTPFHEHIYEQMA